MTSERLHVLLVEDEVAHVELARRAFEARAGQFRVSVASTMAEARSRLRSEDPPHVVISDWLLPDGEGLDLLREASATPPPPLVIMTSHGSEGVAVQAMRAGVVDYVVKSEAALADLPHLAERAVRQRRMEEALRDLAAGTGARGGGALFEEIVVRLARTLRVKYASVAELVAPGRVRTLARYLNGSITANVEYEIGDTPCADVLAGTVRHVEDGVAAEYPRYEDLRLLGARAYAGTPLSAASGELLGLINVIHDCPFDDAVRPETVVQAFAARAAAEIERVRAERQLERQRLFADNLLDMVASLVVVVDPQGRIVRFNRACEQLSGWSEQEVRGRLLQEVVSEGAPAPAPPGSAERAIGSESEWLTRSGERRLISWVKRPVPDERGQDTYRIGTGVDVTVRRRLEADLRRAAIEWRDTFDGLPLGVLVVDAEGRVVRANRAAMERSGRGSWPEVIDRPLAALGPGEPWSALATLAGQLREAGALPSREVTDALTRRTWVVGGRRLSSFGSCAGPVVLNFQDVTETVRLKDQLRQTETMAEIGSIVSGVAHEVRNPLFSISATLDAFESRYGTTEGYERYLGVLRGEIVRLTMLMTELLDFGRPSRPDFDECRVDEVVAAAVAACAPTADRKRVTVITRLGTGLPPLSADRARMTQVLQNLIENAVHFSPPGGQVELVTSVGGDAGARSIEVTVKDSGPGFDPADLSRLFEPFFTRRRGGTGLGLSIVKRIVYDHGGDVAAENHPDGGAVVRVRLPAPPR